MTKKTKVLLLTIILCLIAAVAFITYSWFFPNDILGNVTNNVMVLSTTDYGTITVTYDNENNLISAGSINLNDETAGTTLKYMLKFNINSTSTSNQYVSINWTTLVNTFCKYRDEDYECTNDPSDTYVGNELTYQLYSCTSTQYNNVTTADDTDISSCTKISETTDQRVPDTGSTDKLQDASKITLSPSSTTYYIVLVNLTNLETNQNYNMDKTFSGGIDVDFYVPTLINEILETYTPIADNVTSTYVTGSTGINFGATSKPTNGQGLYINSKSNIASDPTVGTIKYFRGGTYCWLGGTQITSSSTCTSAGGTWSNQHCSLSDSESACTTAGGTFYELKNNVMFAGFAWKIIRINDDDSIRMIYNGTATTARGSNSQISTSAFNNYDNDNAYVGYMYGATGQSTYALTHANTNNSAIKTTVDTWYNNNLASYASQIADSGFCGDRSLYSGNGYGTSATNYGTYNRLYTNSTPTFSCPQSNDLFTLTTSSIGNQALTYPVGLITVDEIVYAGAKNGYANYMLYLQSGSFYWTMNPYVFSTAAREWDANDAGSFLYYAITVTYNSNGVRPVINLKPNVIVTGGAGTLSDPWIIAS